MMPRLRYYLGLKSPATREIFRAGDTPTAVSHGDRFAAVVGPFRTKRGAIFMRDYGRANPHCRCVDDAERLGRE
jgi:hypothetical protein